MAKPKGSTKTGGRVRGTQNKKTSILKSITDDLGLDVPRRLVEIIPVLESENLADVLSITSPHNKRVNKNFDKK